MSLSVEERKTITYGLLTTDGTRLVWRWTPRSGGLCECRPVGHGPYPVGDDAGQIARGGRRTNGQVVATTTTGRAKRDKNDEAMRTRSTVLRSAAVYELLSPLHDNTHVMVMIARWWRRLRCDNVLTRLQWPDRTGKIVNRTKTK